MSDALEGLKAGRGITVREIAPRDEPVGARIESTAAFIGRAQRGPLNVPVLVESLAGFRRRFGGPWHHSNLDPAVRQFFEHGGRRLYVVRVANNARGAMICLPAQHGVLVLRAVEPGATEKIRAAVDYDGIPGDDCEHFNLTLQRLAPETGLVADQEIHLRLSCRPRSRAFIGHALEASDLAVPQLPLPSGRPLPTADPGRSNDPGYVGHVQPGSDGSALTDYDLVGSASAGTGLFALNQVERFDLLHLPPPARGRDLGPAAMLAAERYCRRRSAMLVLDPPNAWENARQAMEGIRGTGYSSPNALIYFPRFAGRAGGGARSSAAGGAVTGLICKLDRRHGAWQDCEHPDLAFRRGLVPVVEVTDADAALLVREGVNVIADTGGRTSLRGSVTLARHGQLDRHLGRLGSRRLCLMITTAIERATRWAVFAPGEAGLANRLQVRIHAYLAGLADAGALADDRFVVHCDAGPEAGLGTSPRAVTILLGFQPAGTGQAISLTLHHTVAGCRVATTAFAPAEAHCA